MDTVAYRYMIAVIWVYFSLLFGWLLLYLFSGDRLSLISLLNHLAVYLFLPLPLIFLANLFLRRMEIWMLIIAGGIAFAWLWGVYFIPKSRPVAAASVDRDTLTVMTFNVLGWQADVSPQVDVIQAEDADVVFLQELNLELAAALRADLAADYPYQALNPQPDVSGMGVLSKYPLQPIAFNLPQLEWVGAPQVLDLNWQGRRVTLINFHTMPTTPGTIRQAAALNRLREDQARALVEIARQMPPAILAGDANTTPLSDAYALLTENLLDVWKEAGVGLGHTFPGSDAPGSARPSIAGIRAPMWLTRIDYIFHSKDFQAISARNARFDGVSDHRGVIATLKWMADQE